MIEFYKIHSNNQFIKDFSDKLQNLLNQHQRILWIVSGGSNITNEVAIMSKVSNKDSARLEILLSDERFGPSDYPASNYNLLLQAGFNPKQAKFENILTLADIEKANSYYSELFKAKIQNTDYIIAELGIGSDSHIAGILPSSTAANSKELSCYYEGPDYQRITLTFNALSKIDQVMIYSEGKDKEEVINNLLAKENRDQTIFPSEIVYKIKSVSIYNKQ